MANLILKTDSYKVSHYKQYPPGTERVYSYYESRGGRFDATVFFGLSYLIEKHLSTPVTQENIEEAAELFAVHFGSDAHFNRAGWEHIVRNHGGRLPVRIKAVPEGMVVPTGNVLMTVENTDSECYWLTNYLETLLCQLWYPITVATQSREIKKTILAALEESGTPEDIGFKLHDFGYRGSTSDESAGLGGAAHLVNFQGTDTFAAVKLLRDYYGEPMAGFSIPAAEHSTITSWGREHEVDAYRNMIQQYGDGAFAVVSDSYDILKACTHLWGGELKAEVLAAPGTLIVRPDSGELPAAVSQVISTLAQQFGWTTNDKGYDVLNKVRVIQGDGINAGMVDTILKTVLRNGWSADNIAFGSGGGLLQTGLDRDTCQFAFKCSQVRVNGEWRDVYKDPVGDHSKASKRGRLSLVRRYQPDGPLATVCQSSDDILQTVYYDGRHVSKPTFAAIRERANNE